MRSFVKGFLDKLYGIFTGTDIAANRLSTASIPDSVSLQRKAGILLGNGLTVPLITRTDLTLPVSSVSYGCDYKGHTFVAPNAPTGNLETSITRLIANASSANWTIREVALKTHKSASPASNVGNILITHDCQGLAETFNAASDKLVTLTFSIARNSEQGGAVLNLLRLFYNLYLKGIANDSPFLPRSGTGSYTYASALAAGPFVVDAVAAKYWGIIVGFVEDDLHGNPLVGPDEHGRFLEEDTDLTYGANTISAVTISGSSAYFTISRDITNGTTVAKIFNRICLLTKGATADPSALMADQVYMMINRVEPKESLAPNQTIRVEYKFEITA
jgi:hypothetical protein